MFLEKIKSEGIAHLSYILGDGMEAVVIDPRRDCQVYVDIAARQGACITRIFETHRNEDYVIGSEELARRTGATIYHGKALDFSYGEGVSEGDCSMFVKFPNMKKVGWPALCIYFWASFRTASMNSIPINR